MNMNVVLVMNLLQRFELNKKTQLYALKGSVTKEEYLALNTALCALRNQAQASGR